MVKGLKTHSFISATKTKRLNIKSDELMWFHSALDRIIYHILNFYSSAETPTLTKVIMWLIFYSLSPDNAQFLLSVSAWITGHLNCYVWFVQ